MEEALIELTKSEVSCLVSYCEEIAQERQNKKRVKAVAWYRNDTWYRFSRKWLGFKEMTDDEIIKDMCYNWYSKVTFYTIPAVNNLRDALANMEWNAKVLIPARDLAWMRRLIKSEREKNANEPV